MNKIFKLSETAQNDVESVCIEVTSVPAKFGGPDIPRTVTKTVPSTVRICLQSILIFGDKIGTVVLGHQAGLGRFSRFSMLVLIDMYKIRSLVARK